MLKNTVGGYLTRRYNLEGVRAVQNSKHMEVFFPFQFLRLST